MTEEKKDESTSESWVKTAKALLSENDEDVAERMKELGMDNIMKPPDKRCGTCGERLVPTRGRYLAPDYTQFDPNAWSDVYTHAGPMLDRHGAWPVELWEEDDDE